MPERLTIKDSMALRIAVTLATLLVVLRHGFNLHRFYPDGLQGMVICDANVFCQCFLSEFSALAIPAFFFISGILFFQNVDCFTDIQAKWRRRVKSLLLPFLYWNTLILGVLILLSRFPPCHKQLVATYSFSLDWQWLLARLSIKPIVGQFWYIRTLLLFCLSAPICLLLYKNAIASICTLCMLLFFWMPVDCGILSSEGMFWFFFGGLIGYRKWYLILFQLQSACWLIACMVSVNILLTIFHCQWNIVSWYVRIALSVYLLFQLSVFLESFPRISALICRFGKHAFFVYALHAILLSLSELLLAKSLPHNPWSSFCCYWGCIVLTVFFSMTVSSLLRDHFPKLASLLNGYR